MTALTLDAKDALLPGLSQNAGGSGIQRSEVGPVPPPSAVPWENTAPPLLWAERVKKKPTRAAIELQDVTVAEYKGTRGPRGLFHGKGVARFASGNIYTGEFEHGHLHGQGKYIWEDGLEYTGGFTSNKITGKGVYTWPSGATYRGEVLEGKRHGPGVMRFAKSDIVYDGQWQDSKRHGQGKLTFDKVKKCFYEGEWQHDLKHGQGCMVYNNGNVYTGEWFEDQKQGQGCMQWASGEVYTGQWAQGLQNGVGQHVWVQKQMPSGAGGINHAFFIMYNRYQGTFENGQRHGYGALYYATGASYEGEWQQDQKHGVGVFSFEDGTVFEGQFENDRACTKEGQVWGPAGRGLKLRILDLLEGVDNRQALVDDLSKDLLCVNTELRQTYDVWSKHKAESVWAHAPIQHSMALTSTQLWQMLRVCQVPDANCPLALINPCLQQACKPSMEVEWIRNELNSPQLSAAVSMVILEQHSPMRQLLFRDFCEALVRIAHVKYRHLPSLQKQLEALLQTNILPHATQADNSKLWLPQQHSAALHLLKDNDAGLQQLFLQIAAAEMSPEMPSDPVTAADSTDSPDNDEEDEEQDAKGETAAAEEAQPESEWDQQAEAAEEEQYEDDGEVVEAVPEKPKPAWSVAVVSFRGVLRMLQEKDVLQGLLSAEQAITAFQQACYEGCGPEQPRVETSASGLEGVLNLDNAMIYPEFVEGLARCAAQASKQGDNKTKSLESALAELLQDITS